MGDFVEYITGKDLYQMFNYGTFYIMKDRSHLNDINVFPVADGDTGNNLLQTLRTIVLESKMENSFYKTLDSISDSALLGARGNSGVIFAQFVNGLQKVHHNSEQVSISEFADMVNESYKHTYGSLSNPVEGTMLTIIKEWASFLSIHSNQEISIKDIFSKSLNRLSKILEDTKKMLDVLTKNDVVDSGALGFVLFVKGIVSYYNQENLDIIDYEQVEITDNHHYEGEIDYKYCTEGLLSYKTFDKDKLKETLETFGDSVIIAQGKSRFRVHIHTNNPEGVFNVLENYGHIESQKIDDMEQDIKLKSSTSKRVIVTDSIADIPYDFLQENNVVLIPINITINGTNYYDKLSVSNQTLFSKLNDMKEYPKTATPSIKYINDLFSKLLLKFDEVFVLTVSNNLSATHNVIKQEAAKLINNGKKIIVYDTYNNSATQGLLVKKAVDMATQGFSSNSIIEELDKMRLKTQILVCLDTFKYATLSGRVPKVIGKIGMFFGLRPIMTLKNGKGSAFGMSFTKKGITNKISKLVRSDLRQYGIDSYCLVHCQNEELINKYKDIFTNIIGKEPEYITEISTATAIHSGIGSVAIGYIKKS